MEPRNLGGVVAELGQDLVGVFAERRRRRPDGRRRGGQLERRRRPAGSRPRRDAPARRSSRAPASGEANAARMSLIGPHGMSAASSAASQSAVERVGEPRRQQRAERRRARSTRSPFVAKRGSPASAGSTERRAQPEPLPLRADGDRDRAVGGRERLVRHDVRMGVAEPPGRDAADERVLRLVHQAAPASIRATRGRSAGPRRRSRTRCARARPARARTATAPSIPLTTSLIATPTLVGSPPSSSDAPGDRHQPARGLDHEVVAGPIRGGADRPVARDGQVDQRRVQPSQRLVVEAEPRRTRRPGSSRPGRRRARASRRRTATPSGCLRSSRMPRLLRLTAR